MLGAGDVGAGEVCYGGERESSPDSFHQVGGEWKGD